jgi:transcriptional regulator with XRE-family HTH domain
LGTKSRESVRRAEYDALRNVVVLLRNRAGLSQRELSRILGMPHTHIARVEGGTRTLDIVEFLDILEKVGADPLQAMSELMNEISACRSKSE